MSCNLTIDQGNSSAKTAVWHDDELVATSVYPCLSKHEIESIVLQHGVTAAIYSSVASVGDEVVNTLRDILDGNVVVLSYLTPMPVTIDYSTPATLGRDRIASAVGAYATYPKENVLVVDLGTAATYDVVTSDAHFIGGNIAPGVNMRLEALHNFTARLPIVDAQGKCPLWGIDTETAMRAGALNGIAGEIAYYRSRLPIGTKVVLTGGSATMIKPLLDFEVDIEPHLVTKGLNCILRYNETK